VGGMKDGNCITGSPEMMLMNAANIQLARDLYHLPTRSQCGITDAKTIDVQAGLETMQNMMMSMVAGVNMFHLPVGVLDSIFTVSLEKMIIDEEILGRVLRIHQGMDVSAEALSGEVIKAVDHGGMYLDQEDTLSHFRHQWHPIVSNWESYDRWQNTGSREVVQRAHEICRQRLQAAPESLIDRDIQSELQAYIRSVNP
jgi:trimethylamine---corrinoid protein Co-methyltransferase